MTERWRCFVAAPIDDTIRAALAASAATWSRQDPADGLRWSPPDGWHLTLAFLGDVDPGSVPGTVTLLEGAVERHAPMHLPTGRLGAFPRPASARVLWYAIGDPDGRLGAIAAEVSGSLGLPSEEPFRPHITLARARRGHVDLRGWIEGASLAAPQGTLHVERLELMRSHLDGGPARYETLATIALRGAT